MAVLQWVTQKCGLSEAISNTTQIDAETKNLISLSLSQNATYPAKYQTTSMMKVSFSLSFTFISGVTLKPNPVTMYDQSRDDVRPEL